MNCLDNLDKCNASCCKAVYFDTGKLTNTVVFGLLTADKKYYHQLHRFEVIRLKNRMWQLTIPDDIFKKAIIKDNIMEVPAECKALTSDNKCKLHNTIYKPAICKFLNEETEKSDNIKITEGCIYG